jgi:hypothetical protein
MPGKTDPQRLPVLYDLRNQRFIADPAIGGRYRAIPSPGAEVIDGGNFDTGSSGVLPPPVP